MELIYAALAVLALFLIGERVLLWCARKRFALVIHVNGTRGKSTVTRMIHALLRHQGMEVFGKTTGSAARLLLPDGTEKSIPRFGPANIREQRNVMIMSAFRGMLTSGKRQNRALVFECNAVQEELQYISMKWLKPDITVITNVREDHVQELGNAEQAARIFAAAVPENSALVTSEGGFIDIWEAAAKQKKIRLLYVNPRKAVNSAFPENTACVLGIADCLGIDRDAALKSIRYFRPDAGAFAVYSWKNVKSKEAVPKTEILEQPPRQVFFADARAANDTESTSRLSAAALRIIKPGDAWRILLLINREDRPDRSELFTRYIIQRNKESCFDEYLCFGHAPLSFRATMKREKINCGVLRSVNDLERILTQISGQTVYIFGVGNFGGKGHELTQWLKTKRRQDDFRIQI